MTKTVKIDKYCSEIEWEQHLKEKAINLIIAPTGSGKTKAFLNMLSNEYNVAFVAPFISLTQQIELESPDLERKKGMKAEETVSFANGRITTFHSAPRLLEMNNIDLLVIDEIHYLIDMGGFVRGGVLNLFWETIEKLQKKFPNMKVVALTATPHFIRLAHFLNFEIIFVQQKFPTAKPGDIYVSRSWTKEYVRDSTFLALYPSRKMGFAWSKKYHGAFISSEIKDSSPDYAQIILGKMPQKKVFTSTVLSTGISITDPVDTVYTNWLPLSAIVQFSARPRIGGHELKVTQVSNPYFLRDGMDQPFLDFTGNYERDFQLLNEFETWYSWQVHQDDADLFNMVYQMIYLPHEPLPTL